MYGRSSSLLALPPPLFLSLSRALSLLLSYSPYLLLLSLALVPSHARVPSLSLSPTGVLCAGFHSVLVTYIHISAPRGIPMYIYMYIYIILMQVYTSLHMSCVWDSTLLYVPLYTYILAKWNSYVQVPIYNPYEHTYMYTYIYVYLHR